MPVGLFRMARKRAHARHFVAGINVDDRNMKAELFAPDAARKSPTVMFTRHPRVAYVRLRPMRHGTNPGNVETSYSTRGNRLFTKSPNVAVAVTLNTSAWMLMIVSAIGGLFCGPVKSLDRNMR